MFSGLFLNKRVSQKHKGFFVGNAACLQEAIFFLEVRMILRTVWQTVIKVMWQKAPKTSRENEGGGPVKCRPGLPLTKGKQKSTQESEKNSYWDREFSVKKDHKSISQRELGHFVSWLLFLVAFILLILSLIASTPMFPSYLSYDLASPTEKKRKHLMSSSKSGATE